MRDDALEPVHLADSVWTDPDTIAALRDRRVGYLFRLARKFGASQTRIANVTGMGQAEVSRIQKGDREVMAIDVLERVAAGLNMPDPQRLTLGLAPSQPAEPAAYRATAPSTVEGRGPEVYSVRRRRFLELAGGGFLGTTVFPEAAAPSPVARLSRVLLSYATASEPASPPPTLDAMRRSVMVAKRNYQACRCTAAANDLPDILDHLHQAQQMLAGDDARTAHALSAEAHHVAASILLKRGNQGLAWVAAERSIQAARSSDDPTMFGSSARIMTHALINAGRDYLPEAATLAVSAAAQLAAEFRNPSPDALSVYGALLLRGAIATARQGDRAKTTELLDEAEIAARRLGGDHNHKWSAFGPTNVMLHRVNTSVALGDAGTAVDYALQIDPERVSIVERKASLFIDTARAFTQWGKYGQAFRSLNAAEEVAPEEVATRSSAHLVLADLRTHAPRNIALDVRDMAARSGVDE